MVQLFFELVVALVEDFPLVLELFLFGSSLPHCVDVWLRDVSISI
jgi:hypothetical protein